jgi:hypothetical protein
VHYFNIDNSVLGWVILVDEPNQLSEQQGDKNQWVDPNQYIYTFKRIDLIVRIQPLQPDVLNNYQGIDDLHDLHDRVQEG